MNSTSALSTEPLGGSVDTYDPERAAIFETFVERTAPPAENPFRCTCDRCFYAARPRPSRRSLDARAA